MSKTSHKSPNLDMESEGIGENDAGNPTVIYDGMEVHRDGSEHLLFIGHFHFATNPGNPSPLEINAFA